MILLTVWFGIPIALRQGQEDRALRFLRAIGFRKWDWRTCWREFDFWLAMGTLLLPFGFVLLLLQWEPVRVRVFRRR